MVLLFDIVTSNLFFCFLFSCEVNVQI
uniref:Uncharacterized protein n=1 Tax=Anguilla anguilla TaxID=7936 RepID=A0A0E9XQI1_ANGAN